MTQEYIFLSSYGGQKMVSVLTNISNIIIPVLIFYIVSYGLVSGKNVYEDFIRGAKKGFLTVLKIMPTLIALVVGVGILRASGIFEFLGSSLGKVTELLGFQGELVPLLFVKMFSSSAATGLVLDIYKTYGTDSRTGMMASIMMSCTETIFYTLSVYSVAAKITKSRWTLPGALICTMAGVIASVILTGLL